MQYVDQHSRFLLVSWLWCANRDVESILQKYFQKSILKILFYFVFWKYFCKVFYFVIFKILFLHYFIFYFENTFEKYFAHHCSVCMASSCMTVILLLLSSGVTRNSGAPGQNIEWGPHKSWTMSFIPCWRYRAGYCRVDSLNCQPWKSFENR